MKVYMCKVWDGSLGDWVDIGVFSTWASAIKVGSNYITAACENAKLIDWEYDTNVSTNWYQDSNGRIFTRVITETEIDRGL